VSSTGITTSPLSDPVEEARRLLTLADGRSVRMRALGGVAVRLSVPAETPLLLPRDYQDIDLIIPKGEQRGVAELMATAGYSPNDEFNAFNGHRRLLYYDDLHSRQVDIFVAVFAMCHAIPLEGRLLLAENTIPLPELLLTKLQVVELNDKDLRDILNLVYHHRLTENGATAEPHLSRIAACCAADWGLWRTVTMNLSRASAALDDLPVKDKQELLRDRIDGLTRALDSEPKSRKWRLRARVGDRVRWYEDVEEVA
jgi:hypothetical protein